MVLTPKQALPGSKPYLCILYATISNKFHNMKYIAYIIREKPLGIERTGIGNEMSKKTYLSAGLLNTHY